MQREGVAAGLIGGLALILIVAGLVVVGGPEQGRKERRDDERAEDLQGLVACLAEKYPDGGAVLPPTLEGLTGCSLAVRFADPYTAEPYRYERRSDRDFAICAKFELPDRERYPYGFTVDPETGCMTP